MSENHGKSLSECLVEREAELAWQRHLDDPAAMERSRQRVTHLGNRISKLNRVAPHE